MAIKQIDREWQDPEDWSDEPEKEFCLDRPSEKLTELIIIFSNSDAAGRSKLNPSSPPTIEGKREGCSGWEGSASAEATYLRDGNVSIYTAAAQAIRFEQDPDPPPGDVELVFYDLVEGKFHWIASGSPLFCHGTLSGEFDLDVASASGQESVQGSSFVVDGVDDSNYSVDINVADPDAREVWDCLPPYEGLSGEYGWLVDQSLIPHRAEGRNLPLTGTPGSRVAEGSFTLGTDDALFLQSATYSWHFVEYGRGN
jgi:hypothetical protein